MANPDDVLFLAAVLEHDKGDIDALRASLKSAMQHAMGKIKSGAPRAEKVASLTKTMTTVLTAPNGSPDPDELVGKVTELHVTPTDVAAAEAGSTSMKLDFESDLFTKPGKYRVEFVLAKA